MRALAKSPPGKNLMGYGSLISFEEIARIWSGNVGQTVKYQRCTVEDMDKAMPGGMGRELGEMMEYINNPGYYGGEEAIKELKLVEPHQVGSTWRRFYKPNSLILDAAWQHTSY